MNAVGDVCTQNPDDKRVLKTKSIYIFLGIIALFTVVTIALAAATLAVVIRRVKSSTNAECNHGMLVCSIHIDHMMNHLKELQKIADTSNNNRAIHTQGFNRTLDYITNYLTKNTNLKVQTQFFPFDSFTLNSDPTLRSYINGEEVNLIYGLTQDFTFMQYSGSADFSDPVRLTSIPNVGCDESDWQAATPSPENSVVLVKRGICAFTDKSLLAAKYRVAGLLIYNDGATCDRNPPLAAPVHQDASFPALFLSFQAGTNLVNAAQDSTTNAGVRIYISTTKVPLPVGNICAHTVTGDATQTIVIGSHSDGVPAGPGINDNGSGSAMNLVLATNLARLFQTSNYASYKYRVKFCWWGAEEVGLVGSEYHVEQAKISTVEGERISDYLVNLNYDMLGSPNFQLGIYDGNTADLSMTPPKAIPGSIRLTELFRDWFISENLPFNMSEFSGRSDYGPFLATGIVASGLDAGADGTKTKDERDYYDQMLGQGKGGIAGAIHDPCYHQACDSLANINPLAYEKLTQGAAYVLEYLGRHSDLRSYLYPQAQIRQLEKLSPYKSIPKYNAQREFFKKTDL
ncbi:unnamed protein product [Didymodactylos carnosus]|uniref:Peptide hydrolase n=1 Tax=Didymodactylos carnosus TaxID=1234261 RepID=A0A815W0G0_9BILA|nr:unnamed protein product [Didymodactylos carnosus]CAF1538851.1 unnamed protein product [Didymodactylos carnosus]CAF4140019.1 unnamed protein product [Didymodactylos carnosus]CAF4398881.1 unnamed protein product [Didymodactylos carnosus]